MGPDATGPAAYGLCNGYLHSHAHGNSIGRSIAKRNLVRAAGGVGQVTAYCAKVAHRRPAHPQPEPSEPEPSEPEPSETD